MTEPQEQVNREELAEIEEDVEMERAIEACFLVCQCPLMVAVIILTGMVSVPMSGAKYYVLEERGFPPSCRAIVHPVSDMGAKIDLGTYGSGGVMFQTQLIDPKQVAVSVYGSAAAASMDLSATLAMESAECKLMVIKNTIIDAQRAVQLPMPTSCGGPEPGPWIPGDDGGVWVTPIILGSVIWIVVRLVSQFLPVIIAGWMKNHMPFFHKPRMLQRFLSLTLTPFFKWQAASMMAPMLNLQVSESCPQIVTTFYSGGSQLYLASSWFVAAIPVGCLVVQAIFPKVGGYPKIVFFCSILVTGSWAVIDIIYYVFLVSNMGWDIVFGVSLDFSISWPQFELAYYAHVAKILFFVIWLLDLLDFTVKALGKQIVLNKRRDWEKCQKQVPNRNYPYS